LFFAAAIAAQTETVLQWNFDKDCEHWNGTNHLKNVQIKDGIYQAVASGSDPFFVANSLDFATKNSRALEFRYRTNDGGHGEIYFTNTTEGQYAGFSPKKSVGWNVLGDEQWHTIRVFPNWNNEKKIVKLRIDFPNLSSSNYGNVFYELDWIRVVDLNFSNAPEVKPVWDFTKPQPLWKPLDNSNIKQTANGLEIVGGIESEPITIDLDEYGGWISLKMSAHHAKTGTLTFYGNSGQETAVHFPLKPDGLDHWYNIDGLSGSVMQEKIHLIQLTASDDLEAKATLKQLLVSDTPQGPAEIEIEQIYQPEAINRTGKSTPLAIRLRNSGGQTAHGIKVKPHLPNGMKSVASSEWEILSDLKPFETKTYNINLLASQPFDGKITLEFDGYYITGFGIKENSVTVPVRIEKSLNLRQADYVPAPKPVQSDYEIGALYYPGWGKMEAWARIYNTYPERKPVLGWYDEGNPEVIDWQIKWSVENGIQYYLVDWYWHKGHQHNDHWIKGFQKAKYKSMFKWAMMWANHNGVGSHSEEDQRAVTKFWIENYFNTPEYYTKNGKPVVMIWSPQNMDNDIATIERAKGKELKKGEGVKRLLDLSNEMAKTAGYKGIYFITMKWPEASTSASDIQWLADAGFEMTSIYHFMHHGGKAKNPLRFDFDLVVDASLPFWETRHQTGILPFLPNLSTGWDSRPWHGYKQTYIEHRTVEGFRKICNDYKKFAEKTGIKSMVLAPTNEWGEGSYAEPNAEFGFGMFETIRETFCKKPAEGWALNYAPSDVGLGPYDLPPIEKMNRTAWDFKDGTQGWTVLMGIKNFKTENSNLIFESTNHDPAITINLDRIPATDWNRLIIRMKVSGTGSAEHAQLFWSTVINPVSETNSLGVPVTADGQFHDYTFDLKSKKNWRRLITSLRFDPVNSENKKIEIESIRLEK
ncbi:MAG: glycoside hydrolase family 99-like domain-containing protein, partial [Planctomycetaceae bacterium]|nr:glycoside hydrolase family 99-like domain-containing protein [Planctomycetaceae bacterium]